MTKRDPAILLASFLTLLASASVAAGGSNSSPENSKVQFLPIPSGISEQEVRAGGSAVQVRLAKAANRSLAQKGPRIEGDRCGPIVIFVDSRGVPVSPAAPRTGSAAHDLVFTFDSPDHPWSETELTLLRTYVGDFYPALKQIYGDPSTSDTIDVVHDPSSGYPGLFTGSVITLQELRDDVLCHEMVHAFHGPLLLGTSWFEEGMRIFYLVPRSLVDRELPLSVHPAPAKTERVFMGREEILSPYLRDRLTTALAKGDTRTLDGFGRFLAPFIQQVNAPAAPLVARYLAAKTEQATQEFYNPSCVR